MLPVIGITGYSGSGKTTLLEKLLPQLRALGLRAAVVKHSHHNAQTDRPGKDSHRMTQAGAAQVMMACGNRWALMTETPQEAAPFDYLLRQFDPALADLVLVEGFKHEPLPKILLHRRDSGRPLPETDGYVLAVAADCTFECACPVLDLNDAAQIARFVAQWYADAKGQKAV
ncbi:Molybdopterin-guanine dinucleotide biosynthesis protein B [Kingella potus]|uniref:Molybdopterin-guanine dinucleotide biosynthesis protein B n=1 Tax=Kingella potus TaxID=265175 RepID=A0A377R486_9NEIS|nr:molybdopterin-guanine dinucleotide biosynthesis protein B [Kingella potus]STR03089.1 Molybdopterin-guanine dinucleotide biosynthesis protein B [Kingella potus]